MIRVFPRNGSKYVSSLRSHWNGHYYWWRGSVATLKNLNRLGKYSYWSLEFNFKFFPFTFLFPFLVCLVAFLLKMANNISPIPYTGKLLTIEWEGVVLRCFSFPLSWWTIKIVPNAPFYPLFMSSSTQKLKKQIFYLHWALRSMSRSLQNIHVSDENRQWIFN